MAKVSRSSGEDPTADWADMRIYLAVLDHGSLGAAAEVLNLSQPTVGRRLSALEERLGSSLFARTGRRMVPTDIGRQIEDAARRMAHEMHAIERAVTGASEGLFGLVTISATEGTGSEWLVSELKPLRTLYPDITVRLNIESRTVDLVGREADIALRLGRPSQLDLVVRPLATLGFGLYAHPDYLTQCGPIRTPDDLDNLDWVATEMDGQTPAFVRDFFAQFDVDRRYAILTNSLAAQVRAVKAGLGIGVLSHRWASLAGNLVRVLPDLEVSTIELFLVSHEDLRHSARIRAVADYILDVARRDANLFRYGESTVGGA